LTAPLIPLTGGRRLALKGGAYEDNIPHIVFNN